MTSRPICAASLTMLPARSADGSPLRTSANASGYSIANAVRPVPAARNPAVFFPLRNRTALVPAALAKRIRFQCFISSPPDVFTITRTSCFILLPRQRKNIMHSPLRLTVAFLFFASFSFGQSKPRARDLGVPFDGTPGPFNAITDVKGVEVGHTTLISGEGKLVVGKGPVRTGVTAILPRGKDSMMNPVFAGWFSQNGNGEMTGTTWVEESGFLEGPVMITNTHSVGVVRDAVIQWRVKHGQPDASGYWWS